jgi:ribosome biogenesis GTPase
MEEKIIKVEDLGYDEFLKSSQGKFEIGDFKIARVITEHKGAYRVKNSDGEYLAKITGKRIFKASTREDYPAVGDWVEITLADKEHATIHKILPRRSTIKRKYGDKNKIGEKNETQVIAVNIDVVFVIEAVDRDYNLNRVERYFAIANDGGIRSAIILNKTDLISNEELNLKIIEIKNRFVNVDIITISVWNDKGLDELRKYIAKGKTYCFLGSSGVGKSSLINKLLRNDVIRIGSIGMRSGRGKHTTTGRQMYFLDNGGIIIDNPGVREVGMNDVNAGIANLFDEIIALSKKCKFVDCTHIHEPGCSVLLALESGKLDKGKYFNYIRLRKESTYHEMSVFEKKEKDQQFGKFIKKAKKDFKNYGHKDYGI